MIHVGVDTGGTFTDVVVLDERTGRLRVGKRPTTPGEPAAGIFDALAAADADVAEIESVVLGTTVATNALIERRGARVLYVTTAGFEDVPAIQRVDKADPYDLRWPKPEPLVARRDCLGVRERTAADGSALVELSDEELERVADLVAGRLEDGAAGETTLALTLLFGFANPEHERRLAAALRRRFPSVDVSVSHEVSPVWREYERASTTIADAYLKPVVRRLVDAFSAGLDARGFAGTASIMKSNGGQMLAGEAAERPIDTVLSGLSGGIVAGRFFGALEGEPNVVTLDMGGTSADIGLVREGSVASVAEFELDFGLPIAAPAIDLVTIGAGGGSIAWLDAAGLLRVGPRSAGAVPGPVCYGRGGEDVTVTDANLVLGRLDPAFFLGGAIELDAEGAERKVAELGAALGLSADEAAQAVVELANESMANAIRRAAIERGVDPRDFQLVAFGGAGPLHASEVAAALGMRGVLVPPHPGLASAFGTLVADRRVDRRWTEYRRSDDVDPDAVDGRLAALADDAVSTLRREGFSGDPLVLRAISMRYVGQNYERDVALGSGAFTEDALLRLVATFHDEHRAVYGYAFPDEPVELVHFNVVALADGRHVDLPPIAPGEAPAPTAIREVHFPGTGRVPTAIHRRSLLPAGARVEGPAVVEEDDSTTLVLPGQSLEVTAVGTMRIALAAEREGGGRSRRVDGVTMSILGEQLVNVAEEMGSHMMRSAYSPIFSESRDFSCALFDARGQMIAQGRFSPAHLGAICETVRCVLEELGPDALEPGDVVVHNDPFRGGCHLPEHMLLRPIFHGDALVALAATIGHLAEVGAMAVGSFASDATEVFQEGLRLPPVKLVARGEPVDDVWKIVLSNHRTPRSTWGDLHAMIGSLLVAERRVQALLDKYGHAFVLEVCDELLDHSERLMARRITELPDGEYTFEDSMEDDGVSGDPVHMRVRVVIDVDRAIVDYTGSDPQARGPVNATFGVTTSATYNAFLQVSGAELPRNAGAYRRLKTIAPLGSVVNVRFPGPSVGGNTETQPKLVGMLLGALAPAVPERVMAAEGVTSCNFLFGGRDPVTGHYYAHYHFEASGWGGRADEDGNSAQNHIHGNCRNTPVEVFETRFPFRVHEYRLVPDSGGAGRRRGGLATRRVLEVTAPEVTVSAMMDRVKSGAWGLFGGKPGRTAAILVRRRGDDRFRTFSDAFGAASPSKFANVTLRAGDLVLIDSAGGGGYGDPREREAERVARDVAEGLVSPDAALADYGIELREGGKARRAGS